MAHNNSDKKSQVSAYSDKSKANKVEEPRTAITSNKNSMIGQQSNMAGNTSNIDSSPSLVPSKMAKEVREDAEVA